ncbi:MAG: hypothetical protein WBD10_06475 [Acidobacteriaceae bacterium]
MPANRNLHRNFFPLHPSGKANYFPPRRIAGGVSSKTANVLSLNQAMPEQHKGSSLPLMLAVLGVALLIATAIAYGIIGKFFHH